MSTPEPALPDPDEIGVAVYCTACGRRKKPIGRDAPPGDASCSYECPGYREAPYPGDLWPGERRSEYGY